MDKQRHEHEEGRELVNQEANKLRANGRNQMNRSTRKINKLWLWLGVIALIFILVWWLFSIGTFADLVGVSNG